MSIHIMLNADLDAWIVMKSVVLRRWMGHVVHMGDLYTTFSFEHPKGRDHMGDQGIDGRII
jgi:hypothetical protein